VPAIIGRGIGIGEALLVMAQKRESVDRIVSVDGVYIFEFADGKTILLCRAVFADV